MSTVHRYIAIDFSRIRLDVLMEIKTPQLRYPIRYLTIYFTSDRERQLSLYGHVVRLPTEDPAHRILAYGKARGWTMPMGRPRVS